MLPKINRLTKDKEFNNVFKRGKSSFDKIIGAKTVENGLKVNRFGVLVSAKISKKATERNKVKRQIRDITREELDKMKIGFDAVIITLPEIKNRTYQEIKFSLTRHFKKLNLYR
ncbi:ribonuclease P protein component [Candidatus Falkowbacteria bacterium]|nr:ribonuclease P protein component [Candidatus Falkowbacteria bacterium]